MASTNNKLHAIASTIYFGTNHEARIGWSKVQDFYFEKYNIDYSKSESWHTLPEKEQEAALKKGKAILKKHGLSISEKDKLAYDVFDL